LCQSPSDLLEVNLKTFQFPIAQLDLGHIDPRDEFFLPHLSSESIGWALPLQKGARKNESSKGISDSLVIACSAYSGRLDFAVTDSLEGQPSTQHCQGNSDKHGHGKK
jgi:hypothetical protein